MTVRQVVVLSATRVRLYLRRGKYDTTLLAHSAGDPVFLIAKRDVPRLHLDSYADDDSVFFKLQAVSPGQQYDLALVESQNLPIIGRALLPQPFIGLTINGQSSDPATFPAGSDVAMAWTLTTNETFGNEVPDSEYYATSGLYSVLNVWDSMASAVAGQPRNGHYLLGPGVNVFTYTHADLLSDFGGAEPASFYVRLWSKQNGRRSFSYVDCTVNRT